MRVRNSKNLCEDSHRLIKYTHTYIYMLIQRKEATACQINLSARLRERFISLYYNLPRGTQFTRTRGQIFLYIYLTLRTILDQERENTSGFSLSISSPRTKKYLLFYHDIINSKIRHNKFPVHYIYKIFILLFTIFTSYLY